MNVLVIPSRCLKVSEGLREAETRLKQQSASIDDAIRSLRQMEDESVQTAVKKIARINESLKIRIQMIHRMAAVLEKVATLYTKTEDRICDHEDYNVYKPQIRYSAVDLRAERSKVNETFTKL